MGPAIWPPEAELGGQMNLVFRDGVTSHTHPALAGMEFTPGEFEKAVRALLAADQTVFITDRRGKPPAGGTNLSNSLAINPDFIKACRSFDRVAQLSICLERLKLEQRVGLLMISEETDRDSAIDIAWDDIHCARLAISSLRSQEKSPLTNLAKGMQEARKKDRALKISDFELALRLIDEARHPELDAENRKDGLPSVPELPSADILAASGLTEKEKTLLDAQAAELEEEARRSWTPPQAKGVMESVLRPVPGYDRAALILSLKSNFDSLLSLMMQVPDNLKPELPEIAASAFDHASALEGKDREEARMAITAILEREIAAETEPETINRKIVGLRLIPEFISYNDTLRKLSSMEPHRRVSEVEADAIFVPVYPKDRLIAKDLVAAELLLQHYYTQKYIPFPALLMLSAMKAVDTMTDMGYEEAAKIVAVRYPDLCLQAIAASKGVSASDREGELLKRNPGLKQEDAKRAASEDADLARELLGWHARRKTPEGADAIEAMADVRRMDELLRSDANMTPASAAFMVADELRPMRDRLSKMIFPQAYSRALISLTSTYSRKGVVMFAKEIVESGVALEFPPANDPFDPELEALLPKKVDSATGDIRHVARTINLYLYMTFKEQERNMIWGANRPAIASSNDERGKEPGPPVGQRTDAPRVQDDVPIDNEGPTKRDIHMPNDAMMVSLTKNERDLISQVMGSQFSEKTLYHFMNMPAGVRELRMMNAIAAFWDHESWREDVEGSRGLIERINKTCAIPKPTRADMIDAVCDPSNLSNDQKDIIAEFFRVPLSKITNRNISQFGVWVRGSTSELGAFWEENYPDMQNVGDLVRRMESGGGNLSADQEALLAELLHKEPGDLTKADLKKVAEISMVQDDLAKFRIQWFFTDKEQRLKQWRSGQQGLFTAGDAVHKLRFAPGSVYTPDELEFMREITGKPELGAMEDGYGLALTDAEKEELASAFSKHTRNGDAPEYKREMMALASFGSVMEGKSLRETARREAGFNAMLDAFGVPHKSLEAWKHDGLALSVAKKDAKGQELPNEDSHSSYNVRLSDGRVISLTAVFDGMGGENKGQKGDKTNGERASALAREVFEMCALAGWMETPEDVRRMLVMADIAIVMEQMKPDPEGTTEDERPPDAQRNTMGTTASITLQIGDEFYCIACGDSECKVFREAETAPEGGAEPGIEMVFRSIPHDQEFGLMMAARHSLELVWKNAGLDMANLDDFNKDEFERQVEAKVGELKTIYSKMLRKNAVTSVLGMPEYIHINNAETGWKPFKLQRRDIIMNSSDGVTKPVCDHEIPIVIEAAGGDLKLVKAQLVKLAEARVGEKPHATLCKCKARIGPKQDDDKTLALWRAEDRWAA
jgi:serine/threonine protein phosphatase PrpC